MSANLCYWSSLFSSGSGSRTQYLRAYEARMVNPFHSPASSIKFSTFYPASWYRLKLFNSLETPCFYLAVGILNFICKAIPTAGIWTQFYDNNELLALEERFELPTGALQVHCSTNWATPANYIGAAGFEPAISCSQNRRGRPDSSMHRKFFRWFLHHWTTSIVSAF